jgi:hypothetical protein
MLQLQFDPGLIPDASTWATNAAMAGSAAGVTAGGAAGGAGAGTAAGVVGMVVGVGVAAASVVVVATGVGNAAATTGGWTFFAVAVTALIIVSSCPVGEASTTCTAAGAVCLDAEAPSDRAPPEMLMATAPEARATATIPTTAPRPRRVRIDLMPSVARFHSAARPAPEHVADGGRFVGGSTMC